MFKNIVLYCLRLYCVLPVNSFGNPWQKLLLRNTTSKSRMTESSEAGSKRMFNSSACRELPFSKLFLPAYSRSSLFVLALFKFTQEQSFILERWVRMTILHWCREEGMEGNILPVLRIILSFFKYVPLRSHLPCHPNPIPHLHGKKKSKVLQMGHHCSLVCKSPQCISLAFRRARKRNNSLSLPHLAHLEQGHSVVAPRLDLKKRPGPRV